jgi:hypothetical protein
MSAKRRMTNLADQETQSSSHERCTQARREQPRVKEA